MAMSEMRPLIFGEVLFDHFPDGSTVLGGAPFNVACHLHGFGLNPLLITRIGDDEPGGRIEAAMRTRGMDCSGVQKDETYPTGMVQVSFAHGEPAYEIVDRVAYDFIDATRIPPLDGRWLLYHGSLALRHAASAAALEALKSSCENSRFVDINLRPPWWRKALVLKLLDGADWVKLNKAELAEIYPDAGSEAERVDRLLRQVRGQIVLTGGEQGATAISTTDCISVVPETASAVIDTVGAGDAFCSVFVAGQLLGWPLDVSMHRAQSFASAIVGIRGATPENREFYRHFTRDWGI
ncbi:PfkB family of carbohydrate kinase [Mariprofundus ferrooxydans PV-1]|uniref:PfkB family of carbohydrate kinase n=2 Tax=Mariprofundus ferrooxydans TaxID=314344 RepID=Q0EY16_9PROT|nr:PfkB family of carbohydrate kinase [Mariprofundus ferrooxydans PV-1]